MYSYCLGLRLDRTYNEIACEHRSRCPYYTNVRLSIAFAHPETYQELDTYNQEPCKYFNEQWKETLETSVAPTDGLMALLSSASSK